MAGGGVRAVATAYIVLGLAAVCFALFAISLDPATFRQLQLQMIKESDPHPPEQGETDCAATAAEAMGMRADAVVVLMWGAAQAMTAMVAVAATSRFVTFWAQVLSLRMAPRLLALLAGVVDLAIGRCHGIYDQALATGYVSVTVSFGLLSIVGFLITLLSNVD